MQKKVVGIVAGVAVAHAVLLVGLMAGGGCRQPEILGPHTYNNGPEFTEIPSAVDKPSQKPVQENVVVPPKTPVIPVKQPVVIKQTPNKKPVVKQTRKPAMKPIMQTGKDGVGIYVVKKGDVLSRIAYSHGMRTEELAAFNNIAKADYNKIRVGQKLRIPTGAAYTELKKKAPKAVVNNTAAQNVDNKNALSADGMYVVKKGDVLERIGRRFGVSAKAIARENNISEDKVLRIGEKLRIPAADKTPKRSGKTDTAQGRVNNSAIRVDKSNNDLDPFAGVKMDGGSAAGTKNDEVNTVQDSIDVPSDTTIEEYSSKLMCPPESLRKLNPHLPADGKIKAGTRIILPML